MLVEETNAGAAAPANDTAMPAAEPAPAATPETPAAPSPSIDDDLKAIWSKHNPSRDDSGRFASDQPAESQEQPQNPEIPDQPKDVAAEPAKPAIEPPHSWSGELKAKWATVPPDVQAYIAQRETEAHQAITRAGQQVKQYEPIGQVLQAYSDQIARTGMHPAQAMHVLFQAQQKLEQDPVQGLIEIGASYGIDLRPAFAGQGQAQAPAGPSPELKALQSELQQLKGQLSARERAEQEAQAQTIEQTVHEFAKDKPYFDQVRPIMASLIGSGAAADLAQAYEMAVHASPDTRTRILEDQRKADEAKRVAEAKAKAEEARKSGAVNVKSAPASPSPRTMDDTLKEVARRAYAT